MSLEIIGELQNVFLLSIFLKLKDNFNISVAFGLKIIVLQKTFYFSQIERVKIEKRKTLARILEYSTTALSIFLKLKVNKSHIEEIKIDENTIYAFYFSQIESKLGCLTNSTYGEFLSYLLGFLFFSN